MTAWVIDRHELENGWSIIEFDRDTAAYVTTSKTGDLMRVTAQLAYVPSERAVWCYHYAGTDSRERKLAWQTAYANARRARMHTHRGWWRRFRRKGGRNWVYSVSIGPDIDEQSTFDEIARRLEDEAFSSITSEVTA